MKPEAKIQSDIVDYIRNVHPTWILFSVPNEATFRRNQYFKQLGMLKGAPDLVLLQDLGEVIFLEVKSEKGRQSSDQKKFELKASVLSHKYHVVRSVEDVKAILGDTMIY